MSLIIFHTQDERGAPLSGVLASSVGGPGPWQALSNVNGDVSDSDIAGIELGRGVYSITFSKAGYADEFRTATLDGSGRIRVGLTRIAAPFPPAPTRDQVCALKTSLQGLTYQTTQYGAIPAWFYAKLNDTDRAIARAAHRAAGDTHIPISLSAAYLEEGTLWPADLRAGYDYAYDLDAFRAVLTEAICDGFFIDLPLAGDGLSKLAHPGPGDYNDPVGCTYGYEWLMQHLARIVLTLQGDGTAAKPDLTQFILFRPGWDAVFYGWSPDGGEDPDRQPDRVRNFGEVFRHLLPNGYLAIEHTPGNIPCGEGGADFAPGGLMQHFDTILSEFRTVHEDSCWQVVARMVPHYRRPADQPDLKPDGTPNDHHPPYYLAPGSPRGRYFYVAFEPTKGGVYEWCRGWCSLADVNAVREYLRELGCELVG